MKKLVDSLRPTRFEEVRGQASAVSYLSRLITRGKLERNILLYGQVGSGKTTLARIYAAALNCEACDPEYGSPCGSCKSCHSTKMQNQRLFLEIAAPDFTNADHFIDLIKNFSKKPREGIRRIIFIDEAHSLADLRGACNRLLKPIEETPEGIVYILATSELDKIPAALRSRFALIAIRPLSRAASRYFMAEVLENHGFNCPSLPALDLIAGFSEYQPRNMLQCLDQLLPEHITIDRVRQVFGSPDIDRLVGYFECLARGKAEDAINAFTEWPETIVEKIRLIRSMLLHIYMRYLHHMDVTIDPLVASIKPVALSGIVDIYKKRVKPIAIDPKAAWGDMIAFWRQVPRDRDEEASMLDIVLFHQTACDPKPSSPMLPTHKKLPNLPLPSDKNVDGVWGARPRAVRRPKTASSSTHLDYRQVRDIVNAASLCTQAYGVRFNIKITLWHSYFGIERANAASSLTSRFTKDLKSKFKGHENFSDLCRITTQERDPKRGLCARTILHLPEKSWDTFRIWCQNWELDLRVVTMEHAAIEIDLPLTPPRSVMASDKYHKECVRWLLASTDPDEKARDPRHPQPHYQPLRALLGLGPEVRSLSAEGDQRSWTSSEAISKTALEQKAEFQMYFLSAFDDNAWGDLMGGWERFEYEDRKKETVRREAEWREAASIIHPQASSGFQSLTDEQRALLAIWSKDAHERPRSWSVWWTQDEL